MYNADMYATLTYIDITAVTLRERERTVREGYRLSCILEDEYFV